MNRPPPRKSSLSGANPIAPAPTPPPPQQEKPAPKATPTTARAQEPATEQAAEGRKKHPPKVSFYSDPDDTARMRGAFRATLAHEGWTSLSHFLSSAVMTEVERLEKKHNGGQPFTPVDPGGIPQGRPMGE
ncbi:hypothetical protein ACHAAC_17075 [Aeromicrobium sp. CF4.19]|uniref:ParB family protein n=1 Tax=Aeromicrobium sp. CF4.19 TaxID=3373082 RepID=UPI003EE7CA93